MILKNKGKFLETIINKSIQMLEINNEGLIYKMPVNSNLFEVNNNVIKAKLLNNTFCDYIGLYKGFYFEFEAKETEKEYFSVTNIRKNQYTKLKKVHENNGFAFILVYFHKYESLYVLNIIDILSLKNKKIPYEVFAEKYIKIDLDNGNINFNKIFNHLINYTL
ncbi:Holliday junction-specific endonuclease [Spiroplasma litorale]|uniref:Holliday junction resolvase RecU n=1 Tax=Spiroplasma litorale TaxID=216942 RepID=A0A0K1W2P1_9MOLU|nr:Holliday junction resolvase RecU [Spiroplasma litorale]AKX34443.1 Holliday junction-specific endonuclease [Spiroplasma litorale]